MYIILTGILFVTAVTLGIWIWRYKRQTEYILEQMGMLEQEDTNYRLSSYCHVGKTEQLIEAFNRVMDINRSTVASLKRGNRSYRESIISISHDIRTPLTSAKGYVQMLLSGNKIDIEKQKKYMENIESRIDDVTCMLELLFEYARLEADEIKLQYEKLNLNNVFADTLSLFYEDFVRTGFEPSINIAGTPAYIYADAYGVKRILENLIRNALVHGTGDYRFCLIKRENSAEIIVSNRTKIIEEEDMERIFERFYTTDQSRARKTTGLGLAIVKLFVEKMGGSVSAELREEIFTIKVVFPIFCVDSINKL